MDELKKIYRIFQIIARLRSPIGTTKKDLAQSFDVNIRTIDRYFKLLKDLGFELSKTQNRFKIEKPGRSMVIAEDLIVFSIEEANIIKDALLNHKVNNPLQKSLLDKLYALTDLDELSETLYKINVSKNISMIRKAIAEKKQIVLNNYHSINSNTITDRVIEPIKFHNYYTYLHAYELKSNQIKQYKTERIDKVIPTQEVWAFEKEHDTIRIDPFGMSGSDPKYVKVYLSVRAKKLLEEEYPDASLYIKNENGINYYSGPVYDYAGISRFIMGLIEETDVLEPQELREIIYNKMKRFINLYDTDS